MADQSLVDALGRRHGQPCALIPVAIRQRNVALLYGDRSGEPLVLEELSELLETLPAVSGAFERLIHERKLQAVEAGRARARKDGGAAPEGAFGAKAAPRGAPRAAWHASTCTPRRGCRRAREPAPPIALTNDDDAADATRKRRLRRAAATARAGRRRAELRRRGSRAADDPAAERGDPDRSAAESACRRRARRTARAAHRADSVRQPRQREAERTRPERPSKLPTRARKTVGSADTAAATPRSDPPPPRTLSQPPPGTGSYSVRDPAAEVISLRPPPVPRGAAPLDGDRT